jgi:hypothetical protein
MSRVIVSKVGGVFYSRGGPSNPVGENGETEGVMRHLLSSGHEVVYFGQWRGPKIDGVDLVEPDIEGLTEKSSAQLQLQLAAKDADVMSQKGPFTCLVNVAGYAPTFSLIDNPNGAKVQAAAVRYAGPVYQLLHNLGLKRVVVNNDPRTYPREQEMSLVWEEVRPVALLDQCEHDWTRVVGGTKYDVRSVHARCESWGFLPQRENLRERAAVCVAHAHIKDGLRSAPIEAWERLLCGKLPEDFAVYGAGWEHFDKREMFRGPISPEAVFNVLRTACCCPVVSHTPGFWTGKPWVCLSQGCVPLLYDGDPGCWDPQAEYVPRRHWSRIHNSADLVRAAEKLYGSVDEHTAALFELSDLYEPDFSRLTDLVRDLDGGMDVDSGVWWQKYGGYRRAA